MAAVENAIEFNGIDKSFGAHAALRSVSFAVPTGSIFGLIGLNGAGKTTLIKSLMDFSFPDAGKILIFGQPATDAMARGKVAYLSERFIPPAYLTGIEYLHSMAQLYGSADCDIARIEGAAAAIDLDLAYLKKRVGSYSKGSGQKLGIAAVLLSGQPLWVLDEPMSGLDPRARACLKTQITAAQRRGATVLFSSHSLADIDELCDAFVLLHQGAVRFVGDAKELLSRTGDATLEAAFLALIDQPMSD